MPVTHQLASAAYRFVWGTFCDWYLELAKPTLQGADSPAKEETRAAAAYVLDLILGLLHPFMPFITEELWRVTGDTGPKRAGMLALGAWPAPKDFLDPEADEEINWLIDLVQSVRSVRAEMGVPAGRRSPSWCSPPTRRRRRGSSATTRPCAASRASTR